MPLFPADNRHQTPPKYSDNPASFGDFKQRSNSPAPFAAPQASQASLNAYRAQNNDSPSTFRAQHNASPWQRGAGYDH